MTDEFMAAAIEEAQIGLREGGIPIGSVLVHHGRILGRGHNRRVQRGSAVLHGEMDALEKRCRAGSRRRSTESPCSTRLSPCSMCSGAISLRHPDGHRRREPDVSRRRRMAAFAGRS
jgi:cytosine deaminase